MNPINKEENEPQNRLTEFEDEKPPKKKQNPALQVLIGIFFLGNGIFRISNTINGDGSWNTFYGWSMIILGSISIASVAFKK